MTKLKIKRRGIILDLIVRHGFEYDDGYFMSFWDLAHIINSTWKAGFFVNKEKIPSAYNTQYAVEGYRLPTLFPAIRHALRDLDYPLTGIAGKNGVEFVMYKVEQD